MKLVTYRSNDTTRSGLFYHDRVYDLSQCGNVLGLKLPSSLRSLLARPNALSDVQKVQSAIAAGKITNFIEHAELVAPIPDPPSCRDAYAFRQHVATARQNRGVPMIPEFDQFPVFYFTNHNAIWGCGEITVQADHLQRLDFELEAAIVIGKNGRNIPAAKASEFIAGLMIMNDFSARQLQMEEMKLNLGPAKGKDFATATGPWLVTLDELEPFKIDTENGVKYNLEMRAFHNGKLISRGNLQDMNWTFAEIIERASYGVDLFPGDIIGSGTVGTGCYLELNGTGQRFAKENGAAFTPTWLKSGDSIDLEIESLGRLNNTIKNVDPEYSILAKKKSAK